MTQQTKGKKQDKKKDDKKRLRGINIPVNQVVAGDLLITKETRDKKILGTKALKAEDFSICEGQWRTHIHIGTICYDERYSTIRIAVEDGQTEAEEFADTFGISVEMAQEILDEQAA